MKKTIHELKWKNLAGVNPGTTQCYLENAGKAFFANQQKSIQLAREKGDIELVEQLEQGVKISIMKRTINSNIKTLIDGTINPAYIKYQETYPITDAQHKEIFDQMVHFVYQATAGEKGKEIKVPLYLLPNIITKAVNDSDFYELYRSKTACFENFYQKLNEARGIKSLKRDDSATLITKFNPIFGQKDDIKPFTIMFTKIASSLANK